MEIRFQRQAFPKADFGLCKVSYLMQHGAAKEAVLGCFRRSPPQTFRLSQRSLVVARAIRGLNRFKRIERLRPAPDLAMTAMGPLADEVVKQH